MYRDYELNGHKVTVETVECGQRGPYTDSRYEFEITTDIDDRDVIFQFCQEKLRRCNQPRSEWTMRDLNSYFKGYYTLNKTKDGWRYFVLMPFTD